MTKAVICGALGRMGRAILEVAEEDPDVEIVGGVEHPDCVKTTDLGEATGISSYKGKPLTSRLEEVLEITDVVIEFSGNPVSAIGHTSLASADGKATVIGTTGFSEKEIEDIKNMSKNAPVLLSPNMSLGVNLLFKLVEIASTVLKDKDFDIELTEIHHRFKKDAPSGTAMKLLEIIKNSIALRGGDVVGDHTVHFLGMGERIELTHRATSRKTFAKGTIEAVKWIKGKSPGFYSMFDVLGL